MDDDILSAIDLAAGQGEPEPAPMAPIKDIVQQPKKRPGRPKKEAPTINVETHGVVAAPANEDDLVELVYCNPMLFKKLFQMYKAFEVSEVEMDFTKEFVKIITKDHLGKSNIYTTIFGRYMNLYYCREPTRVRIRRDNLEKVLSAIGKNHYKLTLILNRDHRSHMYLIMKDIEYDNDDSYEIDVLIKQDAEVVVVNDNDTAYPISFKMSSRHFKTKINNIRKLSPTFTIQKCGGEPLQLTFDKAQKVNWTGIYNDGAKINLKSRLAPEDVFNVSLVIDYIKPFSNSNIGDDVVIAADKREKMSFTTFLDKKDNGCAAEVKVFTEVKDYRR